MNGRYLGRTILKLLLTVWLVSCGCGCLADQLVLGSNNSKMEPGIAQRHVIQVDGRAVEYWTARSPLARRPGAPLDGYVLFFVGKEDRAEHWIDAVAGAWPDRPIEVCGMNYPGSGGSEGPVSLARVGPDALAVYDQLKRTAGPLPIFEHAGSFGTVAALCVAARRPVAGLILQNPPPLRQLILGRYGWWNLWLLALPVSASIPSDLDSISNASRCRAPAIFILSGRDEVIPPNYHQLVVTAYAGPRRVIDMPQAHHNDPLTREAAEQFHRDLTWLWPR